LPPANLPPVPLIKVEIGAGVIDSDDAWGKMIHEKKPYVKNLYTLSL
jgi:hypothetical protein